MRIRPMAFLSGMTLLLLAGGAPAQNGCATLLPNGMSLELRIEQPEPGTILSGAPPCPSTVQVTGQASGTGLPLLLDVIVAFDKSGSTAQCAGTDVNGNGIVGVTTAYGCSDRGDSIHSAEIESVRRFVASLSPAVTRVALVRFADPIFGGIDLLQPLTGDFALVFDALDLAEGDFPDGATDYAGAVDAMVGEFATRGDPARSPVGLFLSDGYPTFPEPPFSSTEPADVQAALDAAGRARDTGLALYTFGVGLGSDSATLDEMATITGGTFAHVEIPGDLVDVLSGISLVGVESLLVGNVATGEYVTGVLGADGSFRAEIGVVPGRNDLGVVALAAGFAPDVLAVCKTWVFQSCTTLCDPRTQGFWHHQCLASGEVRRGGPHLPPLHVPDFEDLKRLVEAEIAWTGQSACEALEAAPPSDPCEKALKQFTALLLNVADERLSGACELELSAIDPALPDRVALLLPELGALLRDGAGASCTRVNDACDAVNTGAALVAPGGSGPSPAPVRRGLAVPPRVPSCPAGTTDSPDGEQRRTEGRWRPTLR